MIFFQASYETLYNEYFPSAPSGANDNNENEELSEHPSDTRTVDMMQAILQMETNKKWIRKMNTHKRWRGRHGENETREVIPDSTYHIRVLFTHVHEIHLKNTYRVSRTQSDMHTSCGLVYTCDVTHMRVRHTVWRQTNTYVNTVRYNLETPIARYNFEYSSRNTPLKHW